MLISKSTLMLTQLQNQWLRLLRCQLIMVNQQANAMLQRGTHAWLKVVVIGIAKSQVIADTSDTTCQTMNS